MDGKTEAWRGGQELPKSRREFTGLARTQVSRLPVHCLFNTHQFPSHLACLLWAQESLSLALWILLGAPPWGLGV